jgi:hypothetical protein
MLTPKAPMESPVPTSFLRVAPPSLAQHVYSLIALLLIPSFLLHNVWLTQRTTALWWIAPLLWLGLVTIGVKVLAYLRREPVYGLDANGISLLDKHNRTTPLMAWTDIAEICSDKQNELLLYTQGRERGVKITPNRQNYSQSAPLLAEHLAPLWRTLTKQGYNKPFRAYFTFPLLFIFIGSGVAILSQSLFPALILTGITVGLVYQQVKSVRLIAFTSDGIALTKVYGRDLISAAAIRTIEVQHVGRGYKHGVLLKLRDNRTISLEDIALDPIVLYCIVAVWHRDQLAGRHG